MSSIAPDISASTNARAQSRCPACGAELGAPILRSTDRLCRLPGTFSVTRCQECGLGVTLPTLDSSALASFYPSSYGAYEPLLTGVLGLLAKVSQRWLAWLTLHTQPMRRTAKLPAGTILDVGCGRGDLGSWFVRRGWSVIGVEPSEQACAVARRRGVDARTGRFEQVDIEPGTCDVVVFRHTLEHFADPIADLRHAREALKPGGIAIVSVPNFGCRHRKYFRGRWFGLDVPRHRVHFDTDTLHAALASAGFKHIETCTSTSALGIPASIQYALAGHCLAPGGPKLRAAFVLCGLTAPATWLLSHLMGEGEVLHAIAHKR